MKSQLWWVIPVLMLGCAGEAPTLEIELEHGHVGDEHAHRDLPFLLESDEAIREELTESPAHVEMGTFARITVVYRADAELPIQLATSSDQQLWSDWSEPTLDSEASDPEHGVFVADLDVPDGEAVLWRIRGASEARPSTIALATSSLDELLATVTTDEDLVGQVEELEGSEAGVVPVGGRGFARYRFDAGMVSRSWHWLLRSARNRGWRGTLYGPRTGLRTYAQQAALWNAYQSGRGAPAFPPWGPSRHLIRNVGRVGRWYQAVDTNDVGTLIRVARGLGVSLHVPYAGEPWHVEARRRFSPPRGYRP